VDVDANKRLVERFYEEVWARWNVAFTEQAFAEDYIRQDLRPTEAAPVLWVKRGSPSSSAGHFASLRRVRMPRSVRTRMPR
jgi:hypothetical protein